MKDNQIDNYTLIYHFCKTCKSKTIFEIGSGLSCGKLIEGSMNEEKDPITDTTKQGHFFTCKVCNEVTIWIESEYSKRYIRKLKARKKRWDLWKKENADFVKKMQDEGHKI